jgi:2-polyprenyl-6-methoxyphenol hydroxylase-like FAD-dependent oxidoreductase
MIWNTGDLIVVQACALQTPRKWPGFMDRLASSAYEPFVHMTKYDGSLIGKFPFGNGLDDPSLPVNRSEFHAMLYEYAQGLGISIRFNATVVEYYESEGHAGVILSNGQKEEADVVVAADGVGSKAWRLILGTKDEPISSGFALYRVTFPAGPALENPTIAKEFEGTKDKISLYLGPGAHVVVGKTEKQICWVLTHRVRSTPLSLLVIDALC